MSFIDKVILVTGGSGFIGNCFCKLLLQTRPNYKVINVDLMTYAANPDTIRHELSEYNYTFYKADIRDRYEMENIFKKEHPNIVVNFAAESHVDNSIKNPSLFLDTNILGTQVLLDLSLKYNVERFHQISTDEVYGDLPLDRKDLLFSEDSIINPSSPYSVSKASADLLCLAYYRTYNLPITISRCSNNYGPYQFPEKLIPLVILNCLHDKPIPVYGDGLNVRDWLYVKDHCNAILKIIEEGKIGQIYNIGGNNEKSNIDIVKIILKQLNKSEDLITYVEDRKGHDRRYAINASKIKNELNWEPNISFDDGIKSTINWYKNNLSWLNSCCNLK